MQKAPESDTIISMQQITRYLYMEGFWTPSSQENQLCGTILLRSMHVKVPDIPHQAMLQHLCGEILQISATNHQTWLHLLYLYGKNS